MKKLLVFIIIVGILVAVAWKMKWIGIDNTESTTIVTFDKDKLKADGERAMDSAKEAGEKAKELGGKAIDSTKDKARELEAKAIEEKNKLEHK